MNRIVVWTFITAMTLMLGLSSHARAEPLSGETQNPLVGSRVFGEKGCSNCHAVDGIGGRIGPDLARISTARSFYDLAAAMWNHLPTMVERMAEPGISRPLLSPQETADLIAFLFIFNYFDPPGNLEAGRRLFMEKKCVVCHQAAGTGGTVGPNLDTLGQNGAPIFVAAAMWNHGPAMASAMRARGIARPTFTKEELLDLIAYLKSASPEPREETLDVVAGVKDEGQRLFREKGCIVCHSIKGEGGRVGPDLAGVEIREGVIGLAAAMWNKAPKMMQAMEQRKISVPKVNAGEMADIVAYLYSVKYFAATGNPNEGWKLLETKGCMSCHSLDGQGGKAAPDLGQGKGFDSLATVISVLWNHIAIPHYTEGRKTAWPRFGSREMADLVAFLQAPGKSR